MPDLIGHRIIDSFAGFNYAIPVFTGMTARGLLFV
jgi:hypothetical protein